MCVFVCVCESVCERERERETGRQRQRFKTSHLICLHKQWKKYNLFFALPPPKMSAGARWRFGGETTWSTMQHNSTGICTMEDTGDYVVVPVNIVGGLFWQESDFLLRMGKIKHLAIVYLKTNLVIFLHCRCDIGVSLLKEYLESGWKWSSETCLLVKCFIIRTYTVISK